jgi:hypothetical protein
MNKEDLKMDALARIGITVIVALILCCAPAAARLSDLRDSLRTQNFTVVRINLNPWGAQLGFETEVAGDDPRAGALAAVIRDAEPGGGHKCANSGAIRFWMEDGSVIGVGLLPSHTEGRYELRLYDGDRYVAVYRVERASLLAALENLGVPIDDPAFRE